MINYSVLDYSSYISLIENLILPLELYRGDVYDNGDNNATIGYGYNLVVRNNNLENFTNAGITLDTTQTAVLSEIDRLVTNGASKSEITDYALANLNITITQDQALSLFRGILPEYEQPAIDLGMPLSKERGQKMGTDLFFKKWGQIYFSSTYGRVAS